MPTEVEAQILDIDYNKVVTKLRKLGAKRIFKWRLFKVAAFFTCGVGDNRFSRVRDEGSGTVTMTTKIMKKPFPDEFEIKTTNKFEEAVEFVKSTNLSMKSFQQKLREKWILPKHPEIHEIVFDIWPGIPMYMEIEGTTGNDIDKIIKLLELDPSKKVIANGGEIFSKYWGITTAEINDLTPTLTFKDVKREMGDRIRKNYDLFNENLSTQEKLVSKLGFGFLYTNSEKSKKNSISGTIKQHIKNDRKHREKMTKKLSKIFKGKGGKGNGSVGGDSGICMANGMCMSGIK